MSYVFQDELCAKLPVSPPEGLLEWWFETHDTDKNNALVYCADWQINPLTNKKEKVVRCTCTACKQSSYMPYAQLTIGCSHAFPTAPFGYQSLQNEIIISGDTTFCPACSEYVRVFHISVIGNAGNIIGSGFPFSVEIIDSIPVFFLWRLEKTVYKDGSAAVTVTPHEAYAFCGKRCYKFVGYYGYYGGFRSLNHWESRRKCEDTSSTWRKKDFFPFESNIFNKTVLQNAKIKAFLRQSYEAKCFLIPYLRTFQKHPQIENLVTQKLSVLINEFVYAQDPYRCIKRIITQGLDWKKKRPSAMLGLNKDEYRVLCDEKWSIDELEVFRIAKASRHPVRPESLRELHNFFGTFQARELIGQGCDIDKIYRYIAKQKRKYPDCDVRVWHLTDYWALARALKLPLETPKDFYPQNIIKAHNRAVELQNAMKEADFEKQEAKQREAFRRLCRKYKDFEFEADGLCIFIARQPSELRKEGRALNHCVGNYVNRHAEGKKCIFFLRQKETPDVSFYTVTLDTDTLRITMNLGHHNCPATQEVKDFSEKWLEYIREVRSKKDERKHKYNRNAECA